MQPVIKERINKIINEKLPEGYKKTSVGIFPSDWEIVELKSVAEVMDGDRSSRYPKDQDIVKEGVLFLSTKNIVGSKFDFTDKRFITVDKFESIKKGKLQAGDLVITMRGSIGNVALFNTNLFSTALINAQMSIIRPYKIDSKFLWTALNSVVIPRHIQRISSGSAQPQLTKKEVEKFPVIVPTINEQQKIADILSTWDKAIELKEQLIEQKIEQKKGLMQKLLTGEVRLPGFDGEWKVVSLEDLGEFKTSSVNKKVEENETSVSLVNYMDVYKHGIIDETIDFMEVTAPNKQFDTFKVNYGDVLFTPSSETSDDIGHSAVVKVKSEKLLFSYHLVRLRFIVDMDNNFKAYVFNSPILLKEFARKATGATRYTLSLKDFKESVVKIPIDKKEQKAIGEILVNSDREINLVQKEVEQLKQQKEGLMQLLLTGKVRVKV